MKKKQSTTVQLDAISVEDNNIEKQQVLDWFHGNNCNPMFVSGKAGTGKTTLIQHIAKLCEEQGKRYAIVAPTAIAAYNVGIDAYTMHSYFQISSTIEDKRNYNIYEAIVKNIGNRLRNIELLIIDEMSMVRADLLTAVDALLQGAFDNPCTFGDLKVLMFGDPYQLPPVLRKEEKANFLKKYESEFFFHSIPILNPSDPSSKCYLIELQKVYRQQDEEFIAFLNKLRNGTLTERDLKYINQRVCPTDFTLKNNQGFCLHLTPTNEMAESYNLQVLKQLPGQLYTSNAIIDEKFPKSYYPTNVQLSYKVGAQIMFIENDKDDRWVNGTLGIILSVDGDKLQVATDQNIVVEVKKKVFEFKERYMRDRVKTLTFTQFPFRLAWALTIHKSQGLTVNQVSIDFGKWAFAPGMAYVAISRCRTLQGIKLSRPLERKDVIPNKLLKDYQKYFHNW